MVWRNPWLQLAHALEQWTYAWLDEGNEHQPGSCDCDYCGCGRPWRIISSLVMDNSNLCTLIEQVQAGDLILIPSSKEHAEHMLLMAQQYLEGCAEQHKHTAH